MLSKVPPALKAVHRAEEYMKGMVSPGTLFEEIGFNYIGLVDGHDTEGLVEILSNIKTLRGPQLLHVVTQKGKGYSESENDPFGMHALSKITPASPKPEVAAVAPTYSQVFGDWLCDIADTDEKVVGITPAMGEGSGMREFAKRFPDRFFDVAIAEQHAVTFAAGMACEGTKPVVAIYSTFLQRAYDQLIHDVALQNLDVLFAIDRAGLVGEDGPTHAGSFDISYLRCIPNMIVMTPSDEAEARLMLSTGYHYQGPAAVRYPRGKGPGAALSKSLDTLPIGKGVIRRKGKKIALLAFGSLTTAALTAAETLDATVADMRFVKPLDAALIAELANSHDLLVTIEENVIMGGAGSAVGEHLAATNCKTSILNLGLSDTFIEHGKVPQMLADEGLDADGIIGAVRARLAG